ncbi:hypothetical protein [Bacillus sp. OK048]|uniref:hypothetical protein n=1 Tax=Bacillus sp. OK048 TaxID=1882761 RepID=UPI0008870198|nr:hypothetical protein [Bacillus sp. OK048]SDM85532.1 hypothetical protein SAMN05443253_10662 [Bacillus sp. OK048]
MSIIKDFLLQLTVTILPIFIYYTFISESRSFKGKIEVISEKDKGTEFIILLPLIA